MKCPNCGNEVDDRYKFCNICGGKLKREGIDLSKVQIDESLLHPHNDEPQPAKMQPKETIPETKKVFGDRKMSDAVTVVAAVIILIVAIAASGSVMKNHEANNKPQEEITVSATKEAPAEYAEADVEEESLEEGHEEDPEESSEENLIREELEEDPEPENEEEAESVKAAITYEQLMRRPDDYIGEKVEFSGTVMYAHENGDETKIAISTDDLGFMTGTIETSKLSQRVLERDKITIIGTFRGLETDTFDSDGRPVIDITELRFE